MHHTLRMNGQYHTASLVGVEGHRKLLLDAAELDATLMPTSGSAAKLILDNETTYLNIATHGDSVFLYLLGDVYEVEVIEPLMQHASRAATATGLHTRAPMPGTIVAIPIAVGDIVHPGDTLVIIESMKLEVSLKATQSGRVAEISCFIGRAFEKDAILVSISGEGKN